MRQQITLFQFFILSVFSRVAFSLGAFENVSSSTMENFVSNKLLGDLGFFSGRNSDSFEIVDGLFVSFPEGGSSGSSLVNFKISDPEGEKGSNHDRSLNIPDLSSMARKGQGGGKSKKLLERLLPLFIMPFLIQSAILPVFLSMLKVMLMKSLMVGKVALLLIAINALRSSNAFKSRSEEKIASIHYGYHGSGMEEYGAYIN